MFTYRGKSITGLWIYGQYKSVDNIFGGKTHKIIDENAYEYITDEYHTIIPETLGLGSGEYDCNEKEIYEGDIVKFPGGTGKIIFDKGTFGILCNKYIDYETLESMIPHNNSPCFTYNDYFIPLWELWWNYQQDDENIEMVEIIGNIYDNSELLKGAKEVD